MSLAEGFSIFISLYFAFESYYSLIFQVKSKFL